MFFKKLISGNKAATKFYIKTMTETQNVTLPHISYQSGKQNLNQIKITLEKILIENINRFWYPEVIDSDDGGYKLNHDIQGRWKGKSNKYIVTQARTVWFFSMLAQTQYGTNEHLEAARHGYEFLHDRMWDKDFGGFYWEVNSSGCIAVKSDKQIYGQAFGLFALSEFAMVSGDHNAKKLAEELFNILENYSHDSDYGGYREFFRRDWKPVPSDYKSYLIKHADIKTMNTHLHLLEALIVYYHLTKEYITHKRLIELIFVQSNSVVQKLSGACTDGFKYDWTPLHNQNYDVVSYGHDLENIWILIDACRTVGVPNNLLLNLYRTLLDYSLRYGFDKKNGGFYLSGSLNENADKREKVWWVQAEALVSTLQMYCITKEKTYLDCFSKTLEWIVKHQIDWQHGDWYPIIKENGKPFGDKSGEWKSPYHNGRAIIKCIEFLNRLKENEFTEQVRQ